MDQNVDELLAAHTHKLRAIVTKRRAGKPLKPDEIAAIGGDGQGGQPPSYDSIGAAAAGLGVPVARLRWAKRSGAPGFRGSRVYPQELLPWLRQLETDHAAAGLPDDKNGLECRRLRQRIEREAWEFQREQGAWMRKADCDAFLCALAETIKGKLRTLLRNELPPKLEGLRAPEIAARMEADVIPALIELVRKPD